MGVNKGHEYYLNEAKKYGDKLITIVATDKNIENFKKFKPNNNQKQRIEDIKNLNISDKVIAGNEDNPMKWISIYSPKIICLGYDQRGFVEKLKKHIIDNNLDIEIIRIGSHNPETYKSSLLKK
ncbi:MAG: adenylyltransferase/cytidyltransferase family protein [Candidatus Gracilibacteria bacterium]|nr:adenylyltransferase/cytidyltransferase family protein [Candidatus Gracilibacteria bacterium]